MMSVAAQTESPDEPIACKGQIEVDCRKSEHCGWTSGYTKADGKEVAGYCRQKCSKASKAPETKSATAKVDTATQEAPTEAD